MDQYADSLVTVPTVMQNYCYAELAASFINFLHYCLLSSVFYGAGKDNRGGLTDSPSAHHPSPHLDCRCPTSIISPIFMPNALSIATLPIFLSWLGTGTKLCWLAHPVAWLVLFIRDIVLMLYLLLSYGQLWAASLIGQSAVMWHSSQSNGEQFTFDIEWLNCAVLQ